jgi:hypothetical protein
MTLLFPVLVVVAGLLCLPAYLYSRRRNAESRWLPLAPLPAVLVWLLLTAAGYGAQSLSNLVEVLWLMAAAVALVYGKVLWLDRRVGFRVANTYVLMALLVLAAVLLRSFMPVLPE